VSGDRPWGRAPISAPDDRAAGSPRNSALAGSFLMDLTWVSDQRGWALAAVPCVRPLKIVRRRDLLMACT